MARAGTFQGVAKRLTARELAFDAALALALVALSLSIVVSLTSRSGRWSTGAAALLVVIHGGSLAWRRRVPMTVLAVNLGSGLLALALGYPPVILGVAVPVAVYTVASLCERRWSITAAAVTIFVGSVVQIVIPQGGDLGTVAGNGVILAAASFFGDSVRQRREYVRRLEDRTLELEQARDELARSAVNEERLRIARELHDILGHTVGSIAVQAGVGAHVAASDPEEAKRALTNIESVSKSALTEIRQILGALRGEGDPPETRPAPGLHELSALVGDLPEGIAVDLDVDDAASSLAPGLQLTIYRVVQEALTNVIRHSGARKVRVTVRSMPTGVRVAVVDDGAGFADAQGGHGLIGMKERVLMHGGNLEAGPMEERGFRVSATIPTGGPG